MSYPEDFYNLCYSPRQRGLYSGSVVDYRTFNEEYYRGWLYFPLINVTGHFKPGMWLSDAVDYNATVTRLDNCDFANTSTMTFESGRYYVELSVKPYTLNINKYSIPIKGWGTWDYPWPDMIDADFNNRQHDIIRVGNIVTINSSTRFKFDNLPYSTISDVFIIKVEGSSFGDFEFRSLNYRPTDEDISKSRFIMDFKETSLKSFKDVFLTLPEIIDGYSPNVKGVPLVTGTDTPEWNRGFYKQYKFYQGNSPTGIYRSSLSVPSPNAVTGFKGTINSGEERKIVGHGVSTFGAETYHSFMDVRLGDLYPYSGKDIITKIPRNFRPFVRGVGYISTTANATSVGFSSTQLTNLTGGVVRWDDFFSEAAMFSIVFENSDPRDEMFEFEWGKNSHTFRCNNGDAKLFIKANNSTNSISISRLTPAGAYIGKFHLFAVFF